MAEEKTQKPVTCEDLRRLIKENGGKPEGLDLSNRTFVEAVDLSGLDLRGIILKDVRFPTHFEGAQPVGAKFDGSELNGADLRSIDLQYAQFRMLNNQPTYLRAADLRGALLFNTNFQGADLTGAKFGDLGKAGGYPAMLDYTDLRGAKLIRANFKGCYFYRTRLEGAFIRGADIFDAHLEEADWGSYKIGEEKGGDFDLAIDYYRRLKGWYTNAGMGGKAAKFYYREKEANRKSLRKRSRHRLALQLLRVFFGYGEEWKRVLYWMALFVFGPAVAYYLFGGLDISYSLYFSVISFTSLGYGKWVDITPQGWVQALGAFQAFSGVFLMALLLVTFFRKWTR